MSDRQMRRIVRWPTILSAALGVFSLLSFSLGAHIVPRYFNPPLGAWWNAHEFWLMEGAAVMFGAVMGLRIARRMVGESGSARRALVWSLTIAIIALVPLTRVCAATARVGWGVGDGAIRAWIAGQFGYDRRMFLDNVLNTSVYFTKTACFGFLIGLVIFGLALVAAGWISRDADAAEGVAAF
jgi:hypothetical protein